jgi:hypothetical protein
LASDEFLDALILPAGIPAGRIILYKDDGKSDRATWGIPQIAIDIAYWLSPTFRTMVTKWIYELGLMGKVSLGHEMDSRKLDSTILERVKTQLLESESKRKLLDKQYVELLGEKCDLSTIKAVFDKAILEYSI